ncbi:hypothetical protein ACFQZJ_14400 [Maribacter chungangensis]|uniref:Uncharacterized protein n=1 Tax=Maribacter chungangensis TaxID=1069117 RepID=A0ABW3B6F5_9FLAO
MFEALWAMGRLPIILDRHSFFLNKLFPLWFPPLAGEGTQTENKSV